MTVEHEGFEELHEISFFERGKKTGSFIGYLHETKPLSDHPRTDALEQGALAAAVLSGAARNAVEVDELVHGVISGIESHFPPQVAEEA
ncbi:MAG TPA: hypothetical protein VJC09_00995 [Candidatus Saccharimonadales bacterium]|nr:hypothetical protein [Candidatus Saccharimonadales bacterium]